MFVVSIKLNTTFWYINNYIDLDQFNTFYNLEYFSVEIQVLDNILTSYSKK